MPPGRRCAAICCWSCCAPPASTCRRGRPICPTAPPGNARLVMPPTASLQALVNAAAGGRRAETALLAPIAAGETPLNELHPAAIATIVQALRHVGRGLFGPPVRHGDGDRVRPLSREEEAVHAAVARGRGLHRDAVGRARRVAQHHGGLRRRPQGPRGLPGAAQAQAGQRRCRGAARLSEVARLCRHDAAHGGAPAVGDPPVLPLPAGRAAARGRSGEHARFAASSAGRCPRCCRATRSTG